MKFRKKPVVIEAEQFIVPEKAKEVESVINLSFRGFPLLFDKKGYYLQIPTLEGNMRCNEYDWIITGIKGEKYPCKPDIFKQTYEPAK